MDDWEKEAFRVFELIHKLERAAYVIGKYRKGIDRLRKDIDYCNDMLGWLSGRKGNPEPSPPEEEESW